MATSPSPSAIILFAVTIRDTLIFTPRLTFRRLYGSEDKLIATLDECTRPARPCLRLILQRKVRKALLVLKRTNKDGYLCNSRPPKRPRRDEEPLQQYTDSIHHPLGIEPMGNLYVKSHVENIRERGLGLFGILNDDLVVALLEYGSPIDRLANTFQGARCTLADTHGPL